MTRIMKALTASLLVAISCSVPVARAAEVQVALSINTLNDMSSALGTKRAIETQGIDIQVIQEQGLREEIAEAMELDLVKVSRVNDIGDNPNKQKVSDAVQALRDGAVVLWQRQGVSCDTLDNCSGALKLLAGVLDAEVQSVRLISGGCQSIMMRDQQRCFVRVLCD